MGWHDEDNTGAFAVPADKASQAGKTTGLSEGIDHCTGLLFYLLGKDRKYAQ